MSATIIIGLVSCVILFCAGAKIKHFVLMGVPAVAAVSYLIFTSEYRMKRVLSFLNPWEDPKEQDGRLYNPFMPLVPADCLEEDWETVFRSSFIF